MVSIPQKRSIATEAITPLMRARARGLSLMSTKCALPDSLIVRAASSSAPVVAAERRVELDRDDELALRGAAAAARSRAAPSPWATSSALVERRTGATAARFASIAPRIAAISAGVVPQQPPIMPAPRLRACAANSAKYSGVACG